MELDDELCLCFHVTKRKVVNFLRVEKPKRAGQLSQCFGAGTGCGWCRPFLERLFEAAVKEGQTVPDLPSPEEYSQQRARYLEENGAEKKNGRST
ncbi:MAG: (2Fe-2S)-binding protein [Pirellulales bacterium]